MKVQCDAEHSIEHLLKAVKWMCRELRTSRHVERTMRLVENMCRVVLFDVQEKRRVEVNPTSETSGYIVRHSVWPLNRYQRH